MHEINLHERFFLYLISKKREKCQKILQQKNVDEAYFINAIVKNTCYVIIQNIACFLNNTFIKKDLRKCLRLVMLCIFYGIYNYFCSFRRNKLKQKPVKNLSKCQKKEKKVKNNTHISLRYLITH